MSLNRCPHCNNPLTADERKGRNCPACGKPLAATSAAEPGMIRASAGPIARGPVAPEISAAPGWGTTRAALAIFGIGWVLVQVYLVAMKVRDDNLRGETPSALLILVSILEIGMIIGSVYFLTGICMSCAAPGPSGAKPWGIGAAFCLFVSLVVYVLLVAADITRSRVQKADEGWSPDTIKALAYTFAGGVFLAKVLFTGCMWGIARHFRKTGLSVALLLYLLLELAGVITLFVLYVKEPGFRGLDAASMPGLPPSFRRLHAASVLDLPLAMLLFKQWYSLGIASGLCVLFLVQLCITRSKITQAMAIGRKSDIPV